MKDRWNSTFQFQKYLKLKLEFHFTGERVTIKIYYQNNSKWVNELNFGSVYMWRVTLYDNILKSLDT